MPGLQPERRGPRRPVLGAGVLAALAALAPACSAVRDLVVVRKPPPRVLVKGYPLDLAYGPEPSPSPSPPRVFAEVARAYASFEPFEPAFGQGARPPIRVTEPCPQAGDDVFPAEPAPLDVPGERLGLVREGRYPWKQEGTFELAGLLKMPVTGLTVRTVRNVARSQDGSGVTYDLETQPVGTVGRQVLTLRVTPGSGVFLLRLQTGVGTNHPRDLRPLPPMNIFPLPTSPGAAISAVGIDPTALTTLNVTGRVPGRVRVDACGQVLEGWGAETTLAVQSIGSTTQQVPTTFNYVVGTGLGGLLLQDRVAVPTGTTDEGLTYSMDVTSTIGATEPSGPA